MAGNTDSPWLRDRANNGESEPRDLAANPLVTVISASLFSARPIPALLKCHSVQERAFPPGILTLVGGLIVRLEENWQHHGVAMVEKSNASLNFVRTWTVSPHD